MTTSVAPDTELCTHCNGDKSAALSGQKPSSGSALKVSPLSRREIFEFLPAALEVEQTPASPIGRAIIWAIVLLFLIAAAWAWFGKVDIVAVAAGKVIPSERVKQIQPLETGTVTRIYVSEGQSVQQGDPLIAFDSTRYRADVERLRFELQQRRLDSQRMQAFEHWLAEERRSDLRIPVADKQAAEIDLRRQQSLLEQQVAELSARLAAMASEQVRQRAERQMTQAEIAKQERIIPVLKQRVEALNTLQQKQYGSRLQYLELLQALIEVEQDLLVQQARLLQLDATIVVTRAEIETLISQQRKDNLTQKQEIDLQIASLQQELIKAQQRLDEQLLKAPIAGHVQQLVVHTLGGVVTPAQPLMLIVPEQS